MREAVLNHTVQGEGPPLLLVHGFGIPFNIWRNLSPFLSSHFTTVIVELPGIGATPLPPEGQDYLDASVQGIEAVRRRLGFQEWIVLGYSTGSRIAEAYIRRYAAHVSRAIFLCPLVISARRANALQFGLRLDRRSSAFGTWILSGWRLRLLISWLGFNFQRDPLSDEWYAEIGAVPVDVLKKTLRAVSPMASAPFSLPMPYMMIWGDRDLVSLKPSQPGEHDYFVHGRHGAPVESAAQVANTILSLEKNKPEICRADF